MIRCQRMIKCTTNDTLEAVTGKGDYTISKYTICYFKSYNAIRCGYYMYGVNC